jgi:hypothetical protein
MNVESRKGFELRREKLIFLPSKKHTAKDGFALCQIKRHDKIIFCRVFAMCFLVAHGKVAP